MSSYPGMAELEESLIRLESNNPTGLTPAEIGSQGVGGASLYMDPNFQAAGARDLGVDKSQQQNGGVLDGAKKVLGKAFDAVSGNWLSLFGIDSQAVTVLIGLILIAGGIFLFKPVQQVVVSAAKEAVKAGAVAA